MLENSLHASVDVISREIRFMSVNPGFVEFDGSFQVMLFHIPKLISGVDISSKSAEVVYGFDLKKPEESYRAVMTLWALDGDYCIFRWTIPFAFFAEKRWAFFQVRIRTTSGTTVESQWSTKLKKVYVTPGFTGGQEAYTQAQQDAIAALNSRVTALEASEGGSGSIQLQVDQTPTENSQNLVTSGGVWQAIQDAAGSDITIDSTPTAGSDNAVSSGGVWDAIADHEIAVAEAISEKQDQLTFDNAPTQGSTNPVTSGGVYTAIQNAGGGSGSVGWTDVSSYLSFSPQNNVSSIDLVEAYYCAALGLVRIMVRGKVINSPGQNTAGNARIALAFESNSKYKPKITTYPSDATLGIGLTALTCTAGSISVACNVMMWSGYQIFADPIAQYISGGEDVFIHGFYYTEDLPT